MVTGDRGRLGIIKRSKEVSTAVVIRYADVRNSIKASLCDPVNEKRLLAAARDMFEQKSEDIALSDFVRDDSLKSIDVIDAFSGMRQQIAGYDFVQAPASQPFLKISGVDIAVNCDILIHRTQKEIEQIGATLFRLTKPDDEESEKAAAKRKDMGLYAATLVYMQIAQNLKGNRTPFPALCMSLDIQNKEVFEAPSRISVRVQNIESACLFIKSMWDSV